MGVLFNINRHPVLTVSLAFTALNVNIIATCFVNGIIVTKLQEPVYMVVTLDTWAPTATSLAQKVLLDKIVLKHVGIVCTTQLVITKTEHVRMVAMLVSKANIAQHLVMVAHLDKTVDTDAVTIV